MQEFFQINILPPFLVSLVVSAIFTPIIIEIAKRTGLIDDPKTHKHPAIIHKKPTPRGGGIAIFLGILIASIFFLPKTQLVVSILLGGGLAVLVGVIDDKFDISPYLRFTTNIVAASIPVFWGNVGINFITNPLGGILHFSGISILPQILAIIWIVWTMNMLNWSKGVDGQMPGIAAIAAATIGLLSLRFYPPTSEVLITAKLSFIASGAAIGFLIFNFYPAKIFPGYAATILGFVLAICSITGGTKLATAILVMGVPITDGAFTIIRRILAGKSPFVGDRGHFHHLLLKAKLSQRKIALLYWSFSAILGAIALNLTSREKLFAILALVVFVGGVILWLSFLQSPENSE